LLIAPRKLVDARVGPGEPARRLPTAITIIKAALIGLTRAMALDHGPEKIRVNAICPGYIGTPLMEKWLASVPDRDDTMRQVLSCHPLGRIGRPRDIAESRPFPGIGCCVVRLGRISGRRWRYERCRALAGCSSIAECLSLNPLRSLRGERGSLRFRKVPVSDPQRHL
jgi:hypothetical protein